MNIAEQIKQQGNQASALLPDVVDTYSSVKKTIDVTANSSFDENSTEFNDVKNWIADDSKLFLRVKILQGSSRVFDTLFIKDSKKIEEGDHFRFVALPVITTGSEGIFIHFPNMLFANTDGFKNLTFNIQSVQTEVGVG